jgi:glycosyltransferase involved in cell wall biosynthesis
VASAKPANEKKKIGIFCGYYQPRSGGVERYVEKLSDALIKLGYQIVIVTSNHEGLPNIEALGGCTIYRLPTLNFAKLRYPIPRINKEYKTLVHKIEKENIDVFLLNTRFHLTSVTGAKMGKRLKRPVMLIDHGTGHFTVNNRFLDYFGKIYEHALTWYIKPYVNRFYGVSEACGRWLKHFGIKSSGVFHNAIDLADGKPVKELYKGYYNKNTVVISYVGRLIKEKGILNLLNAFVELKRRRPRMDAKLFIAGDGPLLKDIKHDYEDPSVEILGRIDLQHVLALNQRAEIFVYPSLYPEGLPSSILEAGLTHSAVIATPRGGTPEVITNGQHGIITDGSEAQLTDALERLIDNPSLRKRYTDALRKRVGTIFTWDVVARKVDSEIKSLKTRS